MIPRPINTLVTMAGVEWNWMNVYRMMPTQCKKANMSTVNIYFKKKQLSLNEDKQADIVSEHHGVQYLRLFLIVLSVSQLSHWFIIYIPYFISSHPYI